MAEPTRTAPKPYRTAIPRSATYLMITTTLCQRSPSRSGATRESCPGYTLAASRSGWLEAKTLKTGWMGNRTRSWAFPALTPDPVQLYTHRERERQFTYKMHDQCHCVQYQIMISLYNSCAGPGNESAFPAGVAGDTTVTPGSVLDQFGSATDKEMCTNKTDNINRSDGDCESIPFIYLSLLFCTAN